MATAILLVALASAVRTQRLLSGAWILGSERLRPADHRAGRQTSLADHLLAPTRIYVKNVLELIENVDVHAIAHCHGGGFWGKTFRACCRIIQTVIDASSWQQ